MNPTNTNRMGTSIRNFRMMAGLTQKELAEKCGLNESTIRNYELGNRYPDTETLKKISNALNISFFALADTDIGNVYGALHALFSIELAYGLRPTIVNNKVELHFDEKLSMSGNVPDENVKAFQEMVLSWAKMRDQVASEEMSESDYYISEISYPNNTIAFDENFHTEIPAKDLSDIVQKEK